MVCPHNQLTKRQLPANYTGPWAGVPWEDRPLFQKYWFMNNGIFMGVFCMIPVILIMWYGVVWVTAIQTPTRTMPKKEGGWLSLVLSRIDLLLRDC